MIYLCTSQQINQNIIDEYLQDFNLNEIATEQEENIGNFISEEAVCLSKLMLNFTVNAYCRAGTLPPYYWRLIRTSYNNPTRPNKAYNYVWF